MLKSMLSFTLDTFTLLCLDYLPWVVLHLSSCLPYMASMAQSQKIHTLWSELPICDYIFTPSEFYMPDNRYKCSHNLSGESSISFCKQNMINCQQCPFTVKSLWRLPQKDHNNGWPKHCPWLMKKPK